MEVYVAIALLLLIFLSISGDLIQSSWAENVSATRSESMDAANFLLDVMRSDPNFWNGPGGNDWAIGPGGNDPCGVNTYPPYTDDINAPTWHPAPACTPSGSNPGVFPDLVGAPVFQYMWDAQEQQGDPDLAQLTVWVQVQEGNRLNVYELNSTRTNVKAVATNAGVLPTPPPASMTPTPTPSSSSGSHPPTPTPKPTASSTPKPSPSPKPSPIPTPSGIFE
jgi:hypothetical protein